MDPPSISPQPAPPPVPATNTVPFLVEPNDHPAPPIPAAPSNHPPYEEMIYTAIEALKEKNGSSKRAIGKYIEQVYREQLPSTHSALLTHHLKRLKNSGMLQMVKKSYKLPRSAPPEGSASGSTPSQSTRPRGRPRKTQPQPPNDPLAQNLQAQPQDANNPQQNAEPVWAALGLGDEPVQAEGSKKRPGRPKKTGAAAAAGQAGPSGGAPARRGRPPGSRSVKRLGRPPKVKPETDVSGGSKRRPGRPPKNQSQVSPISFAPPVPPVAGAAVGAAELPADQAAGAVAVPVGFRPRGRPKKNAVFAAAAALGAGGRGRGRGRGRGGRGRGRGRGGLLAQPRKYSGRPVGRPKKGSASSSTSQHAVSEELRRKLDHFQTKVKESLAVLKPHFNHESPVTAIAAIQELEELGTMDLNAPLRDEILPQQQELPPQQAPVQQQQQAPGQQQQQPQQQNLQTQQLLSQPQVYQQQFPQFHLQQFQHHQQQPQLFQPQPQPQQPQLFQHQPPSPHQQQFHP